MKGIPYYGGMPTLVDANAGKAYGTLAAIDVATGQVKWRHHDHKPMMAGVVTTAGGVLFTSNMDRGGALTPSIRRLARSCGRFA